MNIGLNAIGLDRRSLTAKEEEKKRKRKKKEKKKIGIITPINKHSPTSTCHLKNLVRITISTGISTGRETLSVDRRRQENELIKIFL